MNSTKTVGLRGLVGLIAGLIAASCTADPAGPGEGGAELPLMAEFALQVAADEAVSEVTIEDAALWVFEDGTTGPWAEARELFHRARQAWRAGDPDRAAQLARAARLVLAEALIERGGEEGLDALESHVEIIVERLDEAADEYARSGALRDHLLELLAESRELRGAGELTAAAERLILALGIADHMRHRFEDAVRDAEAYATRAVAAAERVYGRVDEAIGPDAGPRIEHALAHARELTRRANAALDRGAWRRAIVLSRRSIGWSLHALRLFVA